MGRRRLRVAFRWLADDANESRLGPPVVPFYRYSFGWEGSPTKIDDRQKGTLILNSLLENLEGIVSAGEYPLWYPLRFFLCFWVCRT